MVNERRVAVIGATGQIGRLVVRALIKYGIKVVAVTRRGGSCSSTEGVRYQRVYSYDYNQLLPVLSECTDAIVTVGLPYRANVWRKKWPGLVSSIVSSAGSCQVPLTFLDNLYVYGRIRSRISESAPLAPCSKKGEARLRGAEIIAQACANGQDIVVCRSADFLGPGGETTVVPWSSLEKVVRERKSSFMWFGRTDAMHSFSLPSDIAFGLVETCINLELRSLSALHMPVITEFSANDLSRELSSLVGHSVVPAVLGRKTLSMVGVFNMAAREQREMMYQFEGNYTLDDSVFRSRLPDFPVATIRDVVSMLSTVL